MASLKSFGQTKLNRLKTRDEFAKVQKIADRDRYKKCYSTHFVILVAPTSAPRPRLGMTVSKRAEKLATRRNRIKRIVREIFRLNREKLLGSLELVIISRKEIGSLGYSALESEILGSLRRNGWLSKK